VIKLLNVEQSQYFENIVNPIINKFNVSIPIIPFDHDTLTDKSKEALGSAWSYDKKTVYQITIDEYFIYECYCDHMWNQGIRKKGYYPKLEKQSLAEVICHEIAHMTYWRHGKKHTELTQQLINSLNIPA
jgi:hypothetical protein